MAGTGKSQKVSVNGKLTQNGTEEHLIKSKRLLGHAINCVWLKSYLRSEFPPFVPSYQPTVCRSILNYQLGLLPQPTDLSVYH